MAIQFRCYRCRATLRIASAKPGQTIQCGKCGNLLQLQPPSQDAKLSSDQLRTWRTLPPPPPAGVVQPTVESERYWQDVGRETTAIQSQGTRAPSFPDRFSGGDANVLRDYTESSKKRRRRSKNQVGEVVRGMLTLLLVMAALCCGGLVILGIQFNPYRTRVIQIESYAAQAAGYPAKIKPVDGFRGELLVSWRTGSTFEIGILSVNMSFENFIRNLEANGATNATRVQRAGLTGVALTIPADLTTPSYDMEFFSTPDGILSLGYGNGAERLPKLGQKARLPASECEAIDDPDSFFSSLEILGGF